MQYLLQDLVKLPLKERLYIIENIITGMVNNEEDRSCLLQFFERNFSAYVGEVQLTTSEKIADHKRLVNNKKV